RTCAHYKEDVGRTLQRPSQQDEPFTFESVHERRMRLPVLLLFDGARGLPSRATAANDREELLHFCFMRTPSSRRVTPQARRGERRRAGPSCHSGWPSPAWLRAKPSSGLSP